MNLLSNKRAMLERVSEPGSVFVYNGSAVIMTIMLNIHKTTYDVVYTIDGTLHVRQGNRVALFKDELCQTMD